MILLTDFLLGFLLNLFVAIIVVRFIYYPQTRDKHYVFTFLAFNTIIYFVLSLMVNTELGVGVGFGLFAIFSVLRYRTDPVPIREMTYLFIILALPVMNSSGMLQTNWSLLVLADSLILLILWLLEKGWGFHYQTSEDHLRKHRADCTLTSGRYDCRSGEAHRSENQFSHCRQHRFSARYCHLTSVLSRENITKLGKVDT